MLLTIYLNCLQMRNSWLQTWIKHLTSTAAGWFVGSIHRPNLSPYAESLYNQYIDAKSWLEWINNGLCVRIRAASLFAQLGAGRGLVALTVPELCEGHGDFSPFRGHSPVASQAPDGPGSWHNRALAQKSHSCKQKPLQWPVSSFFDHFIHYSLGKVYKDPAQHAEA